MLVLYICFCPELFTSVAFRRLHFETIAGHTAAVLVDETGAFLLGIVGGGEEHAFVTLCFLIIAYAAWL